MKTLDQYAEQLANRLTVTDSLRGTHEDAIDALASVGPDLAPSPLEPHGFDPYNSVCSPHDFQLRDFRRDQHVPIRLLLRQAE